MLTRFLLGVPLLIAPVLPSVQATNKPEMTPPLAVSGGAHLTRIYITRERAAEVARNADLTHMDVQMWFPGKWQTELTTGSRFMINVTSLAAIQDDTGKQLDLADRRNDIGVNEEQICSSMFFGKEGDGPHLKFRLEAPAKTAKTIKRLKGAATVHLFREEKLTFNLAKSLDRPLDHRF